MPYTCQYCDNIFTVKRSLLSHQKTARFCVEIQKQRGIIIDESVHKCSCQQLFTTKYSLLRHQTKYKHTSNIDNITTITNITNITNIISKEDNKQNTDINFNKNIPQLYFTLEFNDSNMINLTKLTREHGGSLNKYFELEETKRFLNTLNNIPSFKGTDIIKLGENFDIWVNKIIIQNYAQHVSMDFFTYVSSKIDEHINLQHERYKKEMENKLNEDKNNKESIKNTKDENNIVSKLQNRIEKLKMRRIHPNLNTGYCLYGHHNKLVLSDHYKIGISSNINKTLAQARRNAPYTLLDFVLYVDKEYYKLVEQMVKIKFSDQRKSRTHEVIDISVTEILEGIIEICKVINIKYSLEDQDKIDNYNNFIETDTSEDTDEDCSDDIIKTLI